MIVLKAAVMAVADAAIAALLAGLVFLALWFQPAWVWVAAPLAMLAGFGVIAFFARRKPIAARWTMLLAPLSYAAPPFVVGIVSGTASWGYVATIGAFYVVGAVLLAAHSWVWASLGNGQSGSRAFRRAQS